MELLAQGLSRFAFPRPDSRPTSYNIIPLFCPGRKTKKFHHPSNLCAYKSAAIILNDFIAPGWQLNQESF